MKSKKLGLMSSVAVCVGLIVATSCLSSLATGIGLVGRTFIIPMFIVMILNFFVGMSFTELNRLMPDVSGGTGQYLMVGFGPVISIVGNVSAYVIAMALTMTAELSMSGIVLKSIFQLEVDPRVISIGILLALFLVNLRGVDLFSKVQDLVVVLLLGSMTILGIIGTMKLGTGDVVQQLTRPVSEGFLGCVNSASIAFWLFIGVEFVIPIAKDMKNPKRDVLLSIGIGMILLFVIQSLLGVGMSNYVSFDGLANDPEGTPHITFATNMLGRFGRYWMGVITMLAAVSTVNSMFASTSRILQGMSDDRLMPRILSRENRHKVAYVSLSVMAILVSLLLLSNLAATNGITFVVLAASCLWLAVYVLIHAAVLILRKRYPEIKRSRRLTLFGIPQIIGAIGDIYMIVFISTGADRILIYQISAVCIALLLIYALIWTRYVMKVKPFAPASLEDVSTVTEEEEEEVWDVSLQ